MVRTDWACALSCSGHWLHCLESPGPGDTAERTSPSDQDLASSLQTKEGDVWSQDPLARRLSWHKRGETGWRGN